MRSTTASCEKYFICPVKGARWLARGMDYHGVIPRNKDTLAYAKQNAALDMAREQTQLQYFRLEDT